MAIPILRARQFAGTLVPKRGYNPAMTGRPAEGASGTPTEEG